MTTKGKLWYCWAGDGCEEHLRFTEPAQMGKDPYDVAIIGAGVVGCALAYELSQFQLRVLLIDKNHDVGEGTSKANSAIIHTGFDAEPGSLESDLVTRASRRWPALAEQLKIPFEPISALLLALDDEQAQLLGKLRKKAADNGVEDVDVYDAARVRALEPFVTTTVRGGLHVHRESITDPFTTTVAYAEVALTNGVDILLGAPVVGIEQADETVKHLVTKQGHRLPARIVVNVAGLGSRQVADHYGGAPFHINPRRGQFLVFDKHCQNLINHLLLPVPTATTKGKLIAPTIFGDVLAGPTAEDLPFDHQTATDTTLEGLQEVAAAALRMLPALADHRPIATYAGLRCNCQEGSYQIRFHDGRRGIVTVTGIRSTGLTASPTLAGYLAEGLIEHAGLSLTPDPAAVRGRPEEAWPTWWRRPYDNERGNDWNPDYGRMVCFCQHITRGGIVHALDSPLRPRTLDAVKRRTRVMTGRCQGFNCAVRIAEIMAEHCGLPLEKITKCGPGSECIPQD